MREGAIVTAHDPVAMANAARIRPDVRYAASVSEAAQDADVVLHLTEWPDYRAIDPEMLGAVVSRRNMIDARCALDETLWRSAGGRSRSSGARELACRDGPQPGFAQLLEGRDALVLSRAG